jgi:N-acetylneuraminate synthase/N,N'-diacetyllegionaminate synthase
MDTLALAFGYPVGFSDHTLGLEVSLAAVARGASVLEKHFTLDRHMEGPDHKSSMVPDELARLVRAVRQVESALGDGIKRTSAAELETIKLIQRRLVDACDLEPGQRLQQPDVVLRRNDRGLSAPSLPLVLRLLVRETVPAGTPIEVDVLA